MLHLLREMKDEENCKARRKTQRNVHKESFTSTWGQG